MDDAIKKAKEALEACLRWHQGDKWREDATTEQYAAWEDHMLTISNALAALRPCEGESKAELFSGDQIYAAWKAIGADYAGLDWAKFAIAIQAASHSAERSQDANEKALNALLWLYRRAKPNYGRLPFVEEAIAALSGAQTTEGAV